MEGCGLRRVLLLLFGVTLVYIAGLFHRGSIQVHYRGNQNLTNQPYLPPQYKTSVSSTQTNGPSEANPEDRKTTDRKTTNTTTNAPTKKISSHSHQNGSQSEGRTSDAPNLFFIERERSLSKGRDITLVYNRVPKCGSRSTLALLQTMSKRNHFNNKHSEIYSVQNVTGSEAAKLVRYITRLKQPSLFDRHVYFIDFEGYTNVTPFYINVIRDPVSKYISGYYYMRANHPDLFSEKDRKMLLDECVLTENRHCGKVTQPLMHTIQFFCGPHPLCRVPSESALQRAKSNVEKHYSVVGILEDLQKFFIVLEYIFPQYFKGVVKLHQENNKKLLNKYSNKKRKEPDSKVIEILKNRHKYELDFYSWVKKKFYKSWEHMREH